MQKKRDAHAGSPNQELVNALRRSKLFCSYESVFSKATGLPLAFRPLEYWQLAHRGKKNENPFCAMLAEHPATLSVCMNAHEEMIRQTRTLPRTVTCPFGLTETAVPVKVGEETIGFLRVGQVLRRAPTRADTKKVRSTITRHGVDFTEPMLRAWEENPLVTPEKYDAIVRLLAFFADQLSALANQLVLEKKNAEPPLVARARKYIERHKAESLSLSAVAAASGVSVFHFCKIFRASTGLKFTDYVARVRIEEARTRLLNPNRRVSEIAYDVGFQSLTQFNRTFRRVFGEAPSTFRTRHAGERRAERPLSS